MANNPRTEPYIRTANTLDKIGLAKQADNVESLMRVGMAMDAGKPLFSNVNEHREYLEFLREAKKLVSSQAANERTAGEKSFVLGELDRYIELWSFMLNEDRKVRLAQKSLPFSIRLGSSFESGSMTPEQQVMLEALKPIFKTVWFNAIREVLGKDNRFKVQDEDANSAALNAIQQHRAHLNSKDASDYSYRLSKFVAFEPLYELGKAIIVNSSAEKNPELIESTQNEALEWIQSSPAATAILGTMVSKALEPEMQAAATLETRQKIAKNAKSLLGWFLNPDTNKAKSELIGMPNDAYFPDGLFDSPASINGQEPGMLWLDDKEASKVSSRVNQDLSVLNTDTDSVSPAPADEEIPFDETSGPQDPEATDADSLDSAEQTSTVAPSEELPVTPKPKTRKGKQPVEAPVEAPVAEELTETPVVPNPKRGKGKQPVETPPTEPAVEADEPIVNAIDTDIPGEDIGMENTDYVEPSLQEVSQETQGENEQSDNEDKAIRFADSIIGIIKTIEQEGSEEEVDLVQRLKMDIVSDWQSARTALATLAGYYGNDGGVSLLDMAPDPEIEAQLTEEIVNKIGVYIIDKLQMTPDNIGAPVAEEEISEEHAPGTESSRPGQYDEAVDDKADEYLEDDEQEDDPYKDSENWPVYSTQRGQKLKRLVRWLAGAGLSAAAIWGIVTQLAPAGAAREAIQTVDAPQSGYSQPMQQPETQYTPQYEPEPQYAPPVQQPQYTPPVQQPAPQQQVPPQEKPKTWANEYDDFWDTRR